MINGKSLVALGALVAASLLAVPVHGWQTASRSNRLTFSGPVGLPGVTLPGGTYIFERLTDHNPDLVVVRNDARTEVYFMAMTERVNRPAGLPRGQMVTFTETPRGGVAPIAAWYPVGEGRGHAFIYRNR